MAIKEELIELNGTKQGIKDAFQEKGVDLTGKIFSDTPNLIREMNVGKGDEIEAFPIGTAKDLKENGKVILNYAADMMPAELYLDGSEVATLSRAGIYCDLSTCLTPGTSTSSKYTFVFKRDKDGSYKHKFDLGIGYDISQFFPYQVFSFSNDQIVVVNGKDSIQKGNSYTNYSGITFSPDYKWMIQGGRQIYVFKLYDKASGSTFGYEQENPGYRFLKDISAIMDGFYTDGAGPGLFKNGDNHYFLVLRSDGNLITYRLTSSIVNGAEVPKVTLLGNTIIVGISGGGCTGWWRHFGGNKVICTVGGYNNGFNNPSNLYVFDMSIQGEIYSGVKNDVLRISLIKAVKDAGVTTINNIMVVNETDVYVWGVGGVCVVRYDSIQNAFVHLPFVFKDIEWTNCFFVNPLSNTAIFKPNGLKAIVCCLDAPLEQSYVASSIFDNDLFYSEASLTGFVKENNDGILKVSTVLDPNAVVPTYPNTYGLNVTINAGYPSTLQDWAQPVLTANGTMGVSDFAAASKDAYSSNYQAYIPFSTSSSEIWASGSKASISDPQWLKFYTKRAIKIETIVMKNRSEVTDQMIGDFVLQGSTDGEIWVNIASFQNRNTTENALVPFSVGSTEFYFYHRFLITSNSVGTSSNVSIGKLTITAQENVTLDEGSIDVSWGWFKSGVDYIKYPSGKATLADVSGTKATTMGLWLVKFGETAKPVISISDPVSYAIRHKLQDVFLSDTLDYFVETPPESVGVA